MSTEELETDLDFITRRSLIILEYVGLPIDKRFIHYYDADPIHVRSVEIGIKEIFYYIDEDLFDTLSVEQDKKLTSKAFSSKTARSITRHNI